MHGGGPKVEAGTPLPMEYCTEVILFLYQKYDFLFLNYNVES